MFVHICEYLIARDGRFRFPDHCQMTIDVYGIITIASSGVAGNAFQKGGRREGLWYAACI